MTRQRRIRVVSAELERNGHYLITQRRADSTLPLLWEFPGGRVREGEEDEAALARCLSHRVGLEITVLGQTMEVEHEYEGYALTLAVYTVAVADDGEPEALAVADVAWVVPEDFGRYTFPGADQVTVDQLMADVDG